VSTLPWELPADPSHPVLSALRQACAENWNSLLEVVRTLAGLRGSDPPPATEEVLQRLECAQCHLENVRELLRWFCIQVPLPTERARERAQEVAAQGVDCIDIDWLSAHLQKLSQGAPPRRRQADIRAFEFMLQSSKNSMVEAVKSFCPCGKRRHEKNCYARLKTGIHSLNKVLDKHAPDVAARYNALHPDKAKRSNR